MNPTPHTKGFTLFYAVLTASLLLAIGIAIFNITFKELILSSGARESANAFYAADTGLECALYWDLRHGSLSSPAFGFYGDSLASGLVGYWRFEDGSGSLLAVDSSGNGNTGTLNNMDGNTAWTNGRVGGGIAFDGINDFINVPNAPSLEVGRNGADFSVAFWINLGQGFTGAWRNFLHKGATDAERTFAIWMSFESNRLHYRISTTAGFNEGGDSAAAISVGSWTHIAYVKSGNTLRLYINGSANATANLTGTVISNTGPLRIGKDPWYPGVLSTFDDLRIYNRALSSTEITRLSNVQSNLQLVPPVSRNSNARCLGADITNPATGWDTVNGWNVSTTTASASTTFDVLFPNGRCATVEVVKNTSTTTVVSRGYSSCNLNDPRRVERAIRAVY